MLTDCNVFSAGETFLSQLRMMPGVKQAGLPSNASTYFSDVRFAITPAGLTFVFPTKMDSGDPLGTKKWGSPLSHWPLSYNAILELNGVDFLRVELEKKLEQ